MFEEFDTLLTGIISGQVTANFTVLMQILLPMWFAGIAVYMVYLLYLTVQGSFTVQDFFKNVAIFGLVMAFLGVDGFFIKKVVPAVMNIGDSIASKILSSDDGSTQTTTALGLVDHIISDAITNMKTMWVKIMDKGWGDILADVVPAGLGTALMMVGALAITVYAGVYLILAKVILALLLSLAPFVLMASAIPQTRGYLLPWIAQIVNYILLIVLFSIGFSIVNSAVIGISDFILSGKDGSAVVINPFTFIMMSAMYAVGYALLNSVVGVASAVSGGANTFDTRGAQRGVDLTKSTTKTAGSLGYSGSKGTLKGIGKMGMGGLNLLKKGVKG